jgi:hypothetical protein
MNIQKFIKIIENNSFSMDERQGQEWEKKLMYSWGPKAAINMAKVVKMSFTSLYPTVPICVKRDENFVMATTDPDADIYYLDIDVFGQRDNPNWDGNFAVGPLSSMEDHEPYLELMVVEAASGQYKGVIGCPLLLCLSLIYSKF